MAFESIKEALFPKKDDTIEDEENDAYETDEKSVVKSGNKMILVEPRAYSESQQIADHLKKRNSVVVNVKRVTNDQAKRIIDFLSGTLYALGGDLQRLGNGIYLCTPKNVDVEGRMSDDSQDKKTKAKIEDEIDF
ncbi:MAG TPA: cell division protein SepF [Bacilli bacterium]|jgi:cell division inhibitor SepF|nr:cell division protein SepF [Bacilli bacterium]HPZ23371.1 cell division protein SepF [Bacilli bacterium]HQC83705.1 cell division protein SepF [Bacilli bacterium]